MSSLFDRLEDQLRTAAQAQVAARGGAAPAPARGGHRAGIAARLRGWLTAGRRMLPVTLALGSTAAIVIAALVLLHPGRSGHAPATPPPSGGSGLPVPGSARARREGRELSRLLAPVQRSAVCRVRTASGPQGPTGRPGRALLGELGVLRQAYLPLHVTTSVDLGLSGMIPYTERDWRLARVSDGATLIVVPVRVRPGAGQPGARCLDAQAHALGRDARRIPASIRAQTVYLGERELAFTRRVITRPAYDSVCLIESGRQSAGADCDSQNPRALRRPSPPKLTSGSPLHRPAYIGMVPDGVASVTLQLPRLADHPALTLRGAVVGNVVVVSAPLWLPRVAYAPNPTVIWRDAAGRIIARLTPPARGGSRAYCLSHRLECLTLLAGTTMSGSGSSGSGRATATTTTTTTTTTSPPSRTTTGG